MGLLSNYVSGGNYKNTWIHFAISRFYDNSTSKYITRIFVNGTKIGSDILGSTSNNNNISNNVDRFVIGNEISYDASGGNATNSSFGGYLDGFHFIIGQALYKTNFSIPTALPSVIPFVNANQPYTAILLAGSGASGRYASNISSNGITVVPTAPYPVPPPPPPPVIPVIPYRKNSIYADHTSDARVARLRKNALNKYNLYYPGYKTNSEKNSVADAITRVRAGGATVPPKVRRITKVPF
jgi:hypothetical protein